MIRSFELERDRGVSRLGDAATLEDLEDAQVAAMGRKAKLSTLQKGLGSLSPEDRKRVGRVANEVRATLQAALADRREQLERQAEDALLEEDRLDLSLPGRAPRVGAFHPLSIIEREAVEVFTSLGFRVVEGPEVEDDWHNFQALNIPPDHPARTMKDSLYVDVPGHPELLLRTETSAVQVRTMLAQPPPVFVVAPGRVYRRETSDPTHLPVFHQIEGLAVDEGITFADLKGTLEAFVKAMFGERRRIRLGPAFFPFVEPGCEVGVSCFRCDGAGCRVCGTGWIELLGAGMVHPSVLENCGYDPERLTGFAFGLGIERVAMLRYEIPDMRMLVDGDVRLVQQFRGVA
ncbi:MAG TPA: phenylalanine--tRNA ligase subunit alpha [Actinomycetota bacterium]|nr:phenylalanine--tRNA ligase subunit alpha [Actinomycetota bacterium]